MNAKLVAVIFLVLAGCAFLASGCSNVGDTNPVSPEKMEEMRQRQSNDRENFKPDVSRKGGQ